MLQLFLQSLVTGLLLATTFFALRTLLRRAGGHPVRELPAANALRCVQPLELTDR